MQVLHFRVPDWLCPNVKEPELRSLCVLEDGLYLVRYARGFQRQGDRIRYCGLPLISNQEGADPVDLPPEVFRTVRFSNRWPRDKEFEIVLALDKEAWAKVPKLKSV